MEREKKQQQIFKAKKRETSYTRWFIWFIYKLLLWRGRLQFVPFFVFYNQKVQLFCRLLPAFALAFPSWMMVMKSILRRQRLRADKVSWRGRRPASFLSSAGAASAPNPAISIGMAPFRSPKGTLIEPTVALFLSILVITSFVWICRLRFTHFPLLRLRTLPPVRLRRTDSLSLWGAKIQAALHYWEKRTQKRHRMFSRGGWGRVENKSKLVEVRTSIKMRQTINALHIRTIINQVKITISFHY